MSFGYSVGDFFTVVQFAWDTLERCKNSTSAFKDLGRDVGNTHLVLRNIYRFWKSEEEQDRDLLTPQQDELKQLAENCNGALEDVEKISKKHGKLETSGSVRARVNYVVQDMIHDFGAIRQRLQQYTGNLALFHTMLTTEALYQASGEQKVILETLKEQSEILKILVIGRQEFWEGKRVEPAYSQVAVSIGQGQEEDQKQQTNEAAAQELRIGGIDDSIILKHHPLISDWLETVILAPTGDSNDDDGASVVGPSAAVDNDASSSMLQGSSMNEDSTRSLEDPSEVPRRKAASISRPSSVLTHRSQSSSWIPPEADEIGNYAATMIAKVLRSKYPSAAGKEVFELPLKRAFNHLDWIHRGWLPRAEVEQQCQAGSMKLHWEFDLSALARIVRLEDEKESNPDHRINLQEFINIVLTVRDEILTVTNIESTRNGLRNTAGALRAWWASSDSKKMLSRHWSTQSRYKPILGDLDPYGQQNYTHFMTYTHEFSGDIPEMSIPLTPNFTNAIYLATRYCISQINAVFAGWRAGLKQFTAKDRDEVVAALNNTLEAAAKFHIMENTKDVHAFHWLDHLVENARIVPTSLFDDTRDCPLGSIQSMGKSCWLLLNLILGFVNDLWGSIEGTLTHPDIQVWRRLRMLDRSRNISAMASIFRDIPSTLEKVKAWKSQHQLLDIYSKDCEVYANLLRQKQEREIEKARSYEVRIDEVKIGKFSHPPPRTPSTLFKIMVNGSFWTESMETKTSTPAWTCSQYHGMLSVKRSSLIRFEFFTRSREFDGTSQNSFGFIEFNIDEVLGFDRLAPVNLRKKMCGESSKMSSEKEVTFSITVTSGASLPFSVPPRFETREHQEQRKRSELPLANYIISHPIPEGWEPRRKTNDGGVYFFNIKDSKPTAALWYDPLHKLAPGSKVAPLPPAWKRIAENGQILYRLDSPLDPACPTFKHPPKAMDPMTFENVLKPVQDHFPGSFFVD